MHKEFFGQIVNTLDLSTFPCSKTQVSPQTLFCGETFFQPFLSPQTIPKQSVLGLFVALNGLGLKFVFSFLVSLLVQNSIF